MINPLARISGRGQFLWQYWLSDLKAFGHSSKGKEEAPEGAVVLLDEVNEAKVQWQCLYNVFNEVSDPRVVEHIIHQIIATEKRYGYLLQLAKEQDIRSGVIDIR